MKMRLGIKSKLISSYGLVLATTLVATAIALYAFSQFSNALAGITEDKVPFMADSMQLAQLGMEISTAVPLLAVSDSANAANTNFNALVEKLEKLEDMLQHIFIHETDKRSAANISSDVTRIRENINNLYAAVNKQVSAKNTVISEGYETNQALNSIDEQLLSIIDTATIDFVTLAEKTFSENASLLETLLHQHVKTMVFALRLQSNKSELDVLLREWLKSDSDIQKKTQKKTVA